MEINKLKKMAKEISVLTLDISYKAKTGHVGSALSISDILTVLYFTKMKLNKGNFRNQNRNRFVLSKGHATASLYAILYKSGILSKKILDSFGQNGGLCEHPEISTPGIEMTAGSLGHGLPFAIGIAYGNKKLKSKNDVFVLVSDGECNEGSVWEAALLAPTLKLDNLTLIVDYNKWQCFGKTEEIVKLYPFADKWRAFGWEVREINGHNIGVIKKTLASTPFKIGKPNLIIANTTSGKGVSLIENQLIGHYKVFNEDEYSKSREELVRK